MKRQLAAVTVVAGALLVVYGLWQFWPPAAWMFGGVSLMAVGLFTRYGE